MAKTKDKYVTVLLRNPDIDKINEAVEVIKFCKTELGPGLDDDEKESLVVVTQLLNNLAKICNDNHIFSLIQFSNNLKVNNAGYITTFRVASKLYGTTSGGGHIKDVYSSGQIPLADGEEYLLNDREKKYIKETYSIHLED